MPFSLGSERKKVVGKNYFLSEVKGKKLLGKTIKYNYSKVTFLSLCVKIGLTNN